MSHREIPILAIDSTTVVSYNRGSLKRSTQGFTEKEEWVRDTLFKAALETEQAKHRSAA